MSTLIYGKLTCRNRLCCRCKPRPIERTSARRKKKRRSLEGCREMLEIMSSQPVRQIQQSLSASRSSEINHLHLFCHLLLFLLFLPPTCSSSRQVSLAQWAPRSDLGGAEAATNHVPQMVEPSWARERLQAASIARLPATDLFSSWWPPMTDGDHLFQQDSFQQEANKSLTTRVSSSSSTASIEKSRFQKQLQLSPSNKNGASTTTSLSNVTGEYYLR